MLVLSRNTNESIRIGPVRLTLIDTNGSKARLGFQAPRSISIVRTELEENTEVDAKQFAKDCLQLLAAQMGKPVEQNMIDFMADEVVRLIGGSES